MDQINLTGKELAGILLAVVGFFVGILAPGYRTLGGIAFIIGVVLLAKGHK